MPNVSIPGHGIPDHGLPDHGIPGAPEEQGEAQSICWGQVTGVVEDIADSFAGNWTGTGDIIGSGDGEELNISGSEYMESNVVFTGSKTVRLRQNVYDTGDVMTMKYRTATTEGGVASAEWVAYTVPFDSLGYSQVRIEY